MSDLTVTFNGVNLSDYLTVTQGFKRNIGNNRQNDTIQVSKIDFAKYKGYRFDSKYIEMPFVLLNNLIQKRRELAKILNVKEPAYLNFSDEPDKFYLAVPSGDINVDEKNFLGIGTITWLVPDGLAYSVNEKESTRSGAGNFTISNDGSYKTYPIIEARMNSDNGIVAFINQKGAILQFGNPDEPDTSSYVESDRVIWDTSMLPAAEASRGWKTNEYQFSGLWDGRFQLNANGTRKFGNEGIYSYVTADSFGSGSAGFKGITYGRKISPDSQGYIGARDFESKHGIWFETENINQTGIFLTELRDKYDNSICSVTFYKTASTNNYANIRINVLGNIKEWRFQPTNTNFYTKRGREFSIVKENDLLRFHVGGVVNGGFIHTIRLAELANIEITDVVYYIGVPITGIPVSRMNLTHSTFRKDNVEKSINIKNLFGETDILRIDTAKGNATLNGIETLSLGALGNNYEEFALDTGENHIECINSEWVTIPVDYKITWRDAYL